MFDFGRLFARLFVVTILMSMTSGAMTPQAAADAVRTADAVAAVDMPADVAGTAMSGCAPSSSQTFVSVPEPSECKMGRCRSHLCVGDYLSPGRADLSPAMNALPSVSRPANRWNSVELGQSPPPPKPGLS